MSAGDQPRPARLVAAAVATTAACLVVAVLAPTTAWAQPTDQLLVTSGGADTVSVLDVPSGTIARVIHVGSGLRPTGPVATSPDGRLAFVAGPKGVYVFEVPTATLAREIALGYRPVALGAAPDGRALYAASGVLDIVDADSGASLAHLALDSPAVGLVFSRDGARAYLATWQAVLVIDTAAHAVVATVPVDDVSSGPAVTGDGSRLYVGARRCDGYRLRPPAASSTSGGPTPTTTPDPCHPAVVIINTGSNAVVGALPLQTPPSGMAVAGDGVSLFLATGDSVVQLDVDSGDVLGGIYAPQARQIVFAPDGHRAYVAGNGVDLIDTEPFAFVDALPVNGLSSIGLTPDGAFAYVSDGGSVVSVVSTATNSIVAELAANPPTYIAMSPDGRTAYVAGLQILILDGATGEIRGTIPIQATTLAVTPDGARLYATTGDGVVSISTATNAIGAPVAPAYRGTIAFDAQTDVAYLSAPYGSVGLFDTALDRLFGSAFLYTGIDVAAAPGGGAFVPAGGLRGLLWTVSPAVTRAFDAVDLGERVYPSRVVVSPDGASAYVAVSDPDSAVLIVDLATKTVAERIALPEYVADLAVDSGGALLFVAHWTDAVEGVNDVSIVDLASRSVRTRVPIGPGALHLAIRQALATTPTPSPTPSPIRTASPSPSVTIPRTPGREYVFVANFGTSPYGPSSISVIDAAAGAVVGSIGTGTGTNAIAVAPDGRRAYTLNLTSYDISVIDVPSLQVTRTLHQFQFPGALALSPDGATLYVSDGNGTQVAALSTDDFRVRKVVATTGRGLVAPDPSGGFFYATGSRFELFSEGAPIFDHGILSVVDVHDYYVLRDIPVGDGPGEVVFSPVDDRAYVLATSSEIISVIDRKRQRGIRLLASGREPRGLAITPDGQTLYVANYGSYNYPRSAVSVVDASGALPLETIVVGSGPRDVAMSLDGSRAYVAEEFTDRVSIIDTATHAVVGHISVGESPVAVTVARAMRVQPVCHGDCNADGQVSIDELLQAVGISLGEHGLDECLAADASADRQIGIADLIAAVRAALDGCPR
jgi:YVTN family beta-propeller protein